MAQRLALMPDASADVIGLHGIGQKALGSCRPQPRLWRLLTASDRQRHLSPTKLLKQMQPSRLATASQDVAKTLCLEMCWHMPGMQV